MSEGEKPSSVALARERRAAAVERLRQTVTRLNAHEQSVLVSLIQRCARQIQELTPTVRSATEARAAAEPRPCVLLVDDSPDVLVTLEAFIEGAGFRVVSANCGDDALRLLISGIPVDAIVTDQAMPGLSGVELLRQAQQIRPGLPALVITGLASVEQDQDHQYHVLRKPFRRAELIEQVRRLVRSARVEERNVL